MRGFFSTRVVLREAFFQSKFLRSKNVQWPKVHILTLVRVPKTARKNFSLYFVLWRYSGISVIRTSRDSKIWT